MATVSNETREAQQKAWEEGVWFNFFLSPEFRRFNHMANRLALDAYLSQHGLELSIDNLAIAVASLGSKLSALTPTEIAQRKAARAQADLDAAEATKNAGVPTGIPAEFTRKVILRMPREEYHKFVAQHGIDPVMARVNEGAI
jgi:hypothetical protein